MISAKQAELLGLKRPEKKIINILSTKRSGLTVTALSALANEPRTTVGFYLNKLRHRGWTEKTGRFGFSYPVWHLTDKNEIRKITGGIFADFGKAESATGLVKIETGEEKILAAYEQIMVAQKAERVYVIQGKRALLAAAKNLPTEFVEKAHAVQKQKPIILEGVTAEACLPVLKNMTLRWLKSHWGRATIIHLVPDEFMDFDAEFFIFKNKVLVIQPAAEKTFTILDENVAHAFQLLTEFIERQTAKVNLNDYIGNLIAEKETGEYTKRV